MYASQIVVTDSVGRSATAPDTLMADVRRADALLRAEIPSKSKLDYEAEWLVSVDPKRDAAVELRLVCGPIEETEPFSAADLADPVATGWRLNAAVTTLLERYSERLSESVTRRIRSLLTATVGE